MKKQKTPLPVCETGNGKGKQTALPGVWLSETDFIRNQEHFQVVSLLLRGMENARPAAELVRALRLRDSCELRCRVEVKHRNGALILSLPTVGYWFPAPGERGRMDARLFARSISARSRNTARSASTAGAWAEAKHGEE